MARSTVYSTPAKTQNGDAKAGFYGERSPTTDGPIFDDSSIFGDDREEFDVQSEHPRPVAAKLDRLFSLLFPDIRFVSAQPNHFADVVRGLRTKPEVKHVVTYDPAARGRWYSGHVQAHDGQVLIQHLAETRLALKCLDPLTGNATRIGVNKEGCEPLTMGVYAFTATRSGAAFGWLAKNVNNGENALMITSLDVSRQTERWSSPISDSANYSVGFIHPTPSGDLAVLCEERAVSARLLILDKDTGATKRECVLELNGTNFSTGRIDGASIFFSDDRKGTAVVGLERTTRARGAQFYAIDFDAVAMTLIDTNELPLATSALVPLANGKVLLVPKADEQAQLVTFSDAHTFQIAPFEIPADFDKAPPLIVNRNQKFAVAPDYNSISFFEINGTKLELLERLPLPIEEDWRATNVFTVMTADDVVYHSREVSNENDEVTYRLYAFDAATCTELWRVDHVFDMPPEVVVNDDGSITWVCPKTAIILNN